jgi:hypothetical protein
MSVQAYGRKFPILLRLQSPRGQVELLETIGKGNYGYVYKVSFLRLIIDAAFSQRLLILRSNLTMLFHVYLDPPNRIALGIVDVSFSLLHPTSPTKLSTISRLP